MKKNNKPTMWTKELAFAEARKYNTKSMFWEKKFGCCQFLKRNGWYEEACEHMETGKRWTKKSAFDEARKYKSRSEFRRKGGGAPGYLEKNGWYEEACEHMEAGKRLNKYWDRKSNKSWDRKTAFKEAKKYKTKMEFCDKSRGAAYFLKRNGWYEEACEHMEKSKKWTLSKLQKIALEYKTRNEFNYGNRLAYFAAKRLKLLDEICSHMDYVYEQWDYNKCKIEAKKYTSRVSFKNGSPKAYDRCIYYKWIDEVCSHMSSKYITWDDELAINTARQFDNVYLLTKHFAGCIDYLYRNKELYKVATSHMTTFNYNYMQDKVNGVYIIEIKNKNDGELYYYVGQTSVFRNRFYQHLNKDGSVFEYLQNNNCEEPNFYIVAENLSLEDVLELEKKTVFELYNMGLNMLNTAILTPYINGVNTFNKAFKLSKSKYDKDKNRQVTGDILIKMWADEEDDFFNDRGLTRLNPKSTAYVFKHNSNIKKSGQGKRAIFTEIKSSFNNKQTGLRGLKLKKFNYGVD